MFPAGNWSTTESLLQNLHHASLLQPSDQNQTHSGAVIIFAGTSDGKVVVLKVSPPTNAATQYEKHIYATIIHRLSAKDRTPCLVEPYAWGSGFVSNVTDLFDKSEERRQIHERLELKDGRSEVSLLITHSPHQPLGSLHDYLAKPESFVDSPTYPIRSILFQILWTFRCFQKAGFRHNDPHPGNILISESKILPSYCFLAPSYSNSGNAVGKTALIDGPRVYLFDHDRASWYRDSSGRRNTSVAHGSERCRRWGQCELPNEQYDWFYFLSYLKCHVVDKEILPKTSRETVEYVKMIQFLNRALPKSALEACSKLAQEKDDEYCHLLRNKSGCAATIPGPPNQIDLWLWHDEYFLPLRNRRPSSEQHRIRYFRLE